HLPPRLPRLGLLPGRLVRHRRGRAPRALHPLGRRLPARRHRRGARDRGRDRLAVPAPAAALPADGPLLAAARPGAGGRARARPDGDERDGSRGRGTFHLLPLLMAVETRPRPPRTPVRRRERTTEDGRRALSAGHALAIAVLALALGSLLNAPGLHKSAYNQPQGWQRDVALALTGALADVSHALLLDRPRRALQAALGRSGEDRIDTTIALPPAPPAPTAPARSAPAAPRAPV